MEKFKSVMHKVSEGLVATAKFVSAVGGAALVVMALAAKGRNE